MKENTESTNQESWMARVWRILVAWDETANTGPVESLERRVSALEQERRESRDRFTAQLCRKGPRHDARAE